VIDGGEVVDYAVVMVCLPDEAALEARIRAGSASPDTLAEVARGVPLPRGDFPRTHNG